MSSSRVLARGLGMLVAVPRSALRPVPLASSLLLAMALAGGCRRDAATAEAQPTGAEQQRQINDQVRAELASIPPPTKSRFATIRSLDQWRNPYLTVQDNLLVLHVTIADANSSGFGQEGVLRPIGARQQTLSIRAGELPAALNAIPQTAWPYGRVLAVEEAHNTPKAVEPQVRRTMESVMRTLSDLGVVVYEWTDSGPEIR